MPDTAPLLAVDDARVDVDEVPVCDGITFRSRGSRVLVLGAPRALFAAAAGLLPVLRGSVSIRGTPAALAVVGGIVAGASSDPPSPPRFTVTDYVVWSARLGGIPRADVSARAEEAIASLQLGPMAKTKLSRLVPHARRATLVAAALATGAGVIALEDPLGGFPEEIARAYATVLVGALADHEWILFAPRIALTSPLALAADEAIVLGPNRIEAQGSAPEIAAQGRRFVARIEPADNDRIGQIDQALSARGARIDPYGSHVVFDLGAVMSTSELFSICAAVDVAVVELVPVARALS